MSYEADLHDPTLTHAEVSRRHGISPSEVGRRRAKAGIVRERVLTGKRPQRPCNICARQTRSQTGTCPACTRVGKVEPAYHHGLYGGRWVLDPVRRVQVWVGPVDRSEDAADVSHLDDSTTTREDAA